MFTVRVLLITAFALALGPAAAGVGEESNPATASMDTAAEAVPPGGCVVMRAQPGGAACEDWEARYDGPGEGNGDVSRDVGVAPDGERVYVTGAVWMGEPDPRLWTPVFSQAVQSRPYAYGTIAYDASTGDELWSALWEGPNEGNDQAHFLVVSPDGDRVYVTGNSYTGVDSGLRGDFVTVAYDAATGEELWAARAAPPEGGMNLQSVTGMGVGPDGQTVFVTGSRVSTSYVTVAYDAATGQERWQDDYAGPVDGGAGAHDLVVAPDGNHVYVTGWTTNNVTPDARSVPAYGTVAYHAATGEKAWVSFHEGHGANSNPFSVDVDPAGDRVFVTGLVVREPGAPRDVDTVAYDAATGEELWVARLSHPEPPYEFFRYNLAPHPDGEHVTLATRVAEQGGGYEARDVASGHHLSVVTYDAATGDVAWDTTYPYASVLQDVLVHPDGDEIYVLDESFTLVAFDAATGELAWDYAYMPRLPSGVVPEAHGLALHPDGELLYATGTSAGNASPSLGTGDYLTIAVDSDGADQP